MQSKLRQEINFIKKREFERDNKNLIPFGYKVFSQTDEDGIINEIFKGNQDVLSRWIPSTRPPSSPKSRVFEDVPLG